MTVKLEREQKLPSKFLWPIEPIFKMTEEFLFLVNPISGGINKSQIPRKIEQSFKNKPWNFNIVITKSEEETIELSRQAVTNKTNYIVAVGGDGTINNIARNLVSTDSVMGIVPLGSGNGFARELGLYGSLNKALEILKKRNQKTIDTGFINGNFFNNLAGVGFDAHIGGLFASAGTRGLKTYAKLVLEEFSNYKPQNYLVEIDGIEVFNEDALIISVCNGPQFGNNAYIAPGAKLDDGILDLCIVKRFPLWASPGVGIAMFSGKTDSLPWIKRFSGKTIRIQREKKDFVNIDGEPVVLNEDLYFEINPQSLNILTP